ncbi:MAG TPA: type II secretion system protein [Pirellulaceae bacterium]|nr:type II secretion system protein [Pirellulaceae bacterium]
MSRSDCGSRALGHRRSSRAPIARTPRRGLTLIELLIVLVILAVMATVAVRSLQPMADQARYDRTARTMNELSSAIGIGPMTRQADGQAIVHGFVADMGRLPIPQGTAPETQLAELWLPSTFTHRIQSGPTTPSDYSNVSLPCGWRGPYLQLGIGENDLRDGWGEALVPTVVADRITQLDWTVRAPFVANDALTVDLTEALVTVTIGVQQNGSPPPSTAIRMLWPDPESTTLRVASPDASPPPGTWATFSNVPIGLRAIHVTVGTETVIRYVTILPGNNAPIVIDLP